MVDDALPLNIPLSNVENPTTNINTNTSVVNNSSMSEKPFVSLLIIS